MQEEKDEPLISEMSWREELPEALALAGFVVLNSRNESKEVKDIVENVTHLVDMTDLYVADNPVGVNSRIQDMIQRLNIQQSNDIILLQLWGMGGIGKTTIAENMDSKDHDKSMDSLMLDQRSSDMVKKLLALIKAVNEADEQAPEGGHEPSIEELL
ncbi:TMV resistance protein N-like, partial [Trifolium medium]|nr:TMV resistance protein N-like [Trifolium medium]